MKRYVYYQPNDKDLKDKTGDCQVRALSKALNISWLEAFDLTIPICRELQTYTIFDGNFEKTKEAMKQLGFDYHGIPVQKGKKRPTVLSFAKEHECEVAGKEQIVTERNGLRHLPRGWYRFKTNTKQKEPWVISDNIKVIRILSDTEVAEICKANGYEPQRKEV